jgi:hypothetical protein
MLMGFGRGLGTFRERALQLALRATEVKAAHEQLQLVAQDPKDIRTLIQGAGIAGDPRYVPWLIKHMDDLKLARLAGGGESTEAIHLRMRTRKPR